MLALRGMSALGTVLAKDKELGVIRVGWGQVGSAWDMGLDIQRAVGKGGTLDKDMGFHTPSGLGLAMVWGVGVGWAFHAGLGKARNPDMAEVLVEHQEWGRGRVWAWGKGWESPGKVRTARALALGTELALDKGLEDLAKLELGEVHTVAAPERGKWELGEP